MKNARRTIVVFLRNEPHEKLIVEVENPQRAIVMIENALERELKRDDSAESQSNTDSEMLEKDAA